MNRLAAVAFASAFSMAAAMSPSLAAPGRPVDVVQFGHSMGPGFGISAVAWAPDGERAVTLGHDGRIIFWDAGKGWVVARPGAGAWAHGLAVSPDGAFVLETGEPGPREGCARVVDLAIQHATGWLAACPKLWIGGRRSRLLVARPEGCDPRSCRTGRCRSFAPGPNLSGWSSMRPDDRAAPD
jgi:hypothetical protein